MARFLLASCMLASISFAQGNPDFSGTWNLDPDKSDDGEAVILGGLGDPDRMSPKDRRIAERLMELVRALQLLEIRQSPSDFRLYDEADNVRIYYMDGKKHQRETPWGEKLETVTKWEGSALHMQTDGKDLGKISEIYSMEGSQLLYTVKMKLDDVKEEIVVRTFYNRAK
ncbi:MAG TPA: hypothetical protein VIG29_05320 [Vicinamibacteria bacterium]|jgi:hypothetical protein